MNPNNISDIFFDLDHTLWDFDKNSAVAFETIFAKHKINLGLPLFLETYNPINQRYWSLYQRNEVNKEELRFKRLQDTFSACDFSVSGEIIEKLSEDYIVHLPESNHLFPGVVDTLNYLHKKYTLHIITNGFQEVQQQKLSNSKIEHYFKTLTTSEEAGAKKPDPRIFGFALEKAKCRKDTSLMIGDNLEADVQGALDFGMQAIHFSETCDHSGYVIAKHQSLFELL